METKGQIRRALRQRRDSLADCQIQRLSKGICENLESHSWYRQAKTVCFYYPLGKEADVLPLAEKALRTGKTVAFPRVNGTEMDFYQTASLTEFQEGSFHVMEPVGKEKICDEKALVLTPGLGFDVQGGRIGYGKGYYDRYFARCPQMRKLGICYGLQLA